MAKLNFGHRITLSDRKFMRENPQFDWGPHSGFDKPNKRKRIGATSGARRGVVSELRSRPGALSEEDIAAGRGRAESQARHFPFLLNPFSLLPMESGGLMSK